VNGALVGPSVCNVRSITITATKCRWTNREVAAGTGVATTGARLRQVVQTLAPDGPRLESQTGLSHLLRAETKQKTERQKAFANKMSCSTGGA